MANQIIFVTMEMSNMDNGTFHISRVTLPWLKHSGHILISRFCHVLRLVRFRHDIDWPHLLHALTNHAHLAQWLMQCLCRLCLLKLIMRQALV